MGKRFLNETSGQAEYCYKPGNRTEMTFSRKNMHRLRKDIKWDHKSENVERKKIKDELSPIFSYE